MARVPKLSIIIPVRNEQQTITSVLRSLARQDRISDCHVLVVDGESTDGTANLAEAFPFVEVVNSLPGLARQMNRGAAASESDALWFLHSDATLPSNSTVAHILTALSDPGVVGGACKFQIRGDDLYYRLVSTLVNMRTRWLRRPYGDQGIFVRKAIFHKAGGYREMPCSDLDLFLRIRALGEVRILKTRVATSARTWQRYGKVTTTLWHLKEWLGYEWDRRAGKLPQEDELKPPIISQDSPENSRMT